MAKVSKKTKLSDDEMKLNEMLEEIDFNIEKGKKLFNRLRSIKSATKKKAIKAKMSEYTAKNKKLLIEFNKLKRRLNKKNVADSKVKGKREPSSFNIDVRNYMAKHNVTMIVASKAVSKCRKAALKKMY